jgi:methanogenic corrinoid protein MtbC1
MTASRQSGPFQGRGNASDPADQRLALLSATLSEQIIPRLLQAHAQDEGHEDSASDYRAQAGRPISSADVKDLVRMVLLPDDRPARASVEAMRLRGIPVETLFIDLLALAARHLGELWEEDLCNFADVTVGVGRLQQAMRDLSPGLVTRSPSGDQPRRILLLPSPGEQHTFGLVMVGDFFRSAGWDVAGGPQTSTDVEGLVRREWYDVVGFSLASQVHLPRLAPAIAAVRKASINPRIGILVGGPMFLRQAGLASEVGADAVAINGSLAPEIAGKLVETRVAPL